MKAFEFKPKLFTTLKNYTRENFMTDLMAGIIVGIVALPLAIAFGIASGVTPEKGIITAIVAGFIISFLGGSKVQIGGPTGAFIVIIYGIIQEYGIEGLMVATMMGVHDEKLTIIKSRKNSPVALLLHLVFICPIAKRFYNSTNKYTVFMIDSSQFYLFL